MGYALEIQVYIVLEQAALYIQQSGRLLEQPKLNYIFSLFAKWYITI